MVSFTIVLVTVAALAGQTLAQSPMPRTCTAGQAYCGWHLTNNDSTRAFWLQQMSDAQPGLDPQRQFDALYICKPGGATLEYSDYCPRTGPLLCQPNNSGKCTGLNDCCAA